MKTKAVCLSFTVQETTFHSHWSKKKGKKKVGEPCNLFDDMERNVQSKRADKEHTLGNINGHSYTDIGQLDGKL